MTGTVTHFEIYGEEPAALAEFYSQLLGWRLERASGLDYWRIETGAPPARGYSGGLTYRAIAGVRGWMHYVREASQLDDTMAAASGSGRLCCGPRLPCRRQLGTRSSLTQKATRSPSGSRTRTRCLCQSRSDGRREVAAGPSPMWPGPHWRAVKQKEPRTSDDCNPSSERATIMYFTDDSLFPENMRPLVITAAPYAPSWLPGDAPDIAVTWDEQVQAAVDC